MLDLKFNPTEIIYNGRMTLRKGNKKIIIEGEVRNEFLYDYKIVFEATVIETNNNNLVELGEYKLFAGDLEADIYLHKIHKNNGYRVIGRVLGELSSAKTGLNLIEMKMINLAPIGSDIIESKSLIYRGSSILEYENWIIKIEKRPKYKEIYENLTNQGGYAWTHNVSIYDRNNKIFNYDEVESVLEKLYSYFQFLCGRSVYPSVIIGYLNTDNIFRLYNERKIDQWQTLNTWYPKTNAEIYNDLFNSFSDLWDIKLFNNKKNIILGTYLECFSNVTLENRISSVQIALELLVQLYLVEHKNIISKRQFKSMAIKSLIKKLCEIMNIELEEPKNYLHKYIVTEANPIDYFVDVRNSIVHAREKVKLNLETLKVTYNIGLWILELILLKLFKYTGKYKNRLSENMFSGDYELGGVYYPVPWQ